MLTVPATTLLPTVANSASEPHKRYIRLHRLHVHSPRLLPKRPDASLYYEATASIILRDDYIEAIKKAGPVTTVTKPGPDGVTLSKLKSDIVKILITDRGGGCVRALTLMEEAMVLLADGCKGHLADLLIEDWGKPFKAHLKQAHALILFIINHGALYGLFASFSEVSALLIPADTRFATEIICARSLQKDKPQVRIRYERYSPTRSTRSGTCDRTPRCVRLRVT